MKLPPSLPPNAVPEFAAQRARLLVGCYRREDFADVDIASRAFIAVLAHYPTKVVTEVTEPATGIPSQLKWPPAISEVVEACEKAMAPIKREYDRNMIDYQQARRIAPPHPGPKMTLADIEAKLNRPLSDFVNHVPDDGVAARISREQEFRRREAQDQIQAAQSAEREKLITLAMQSHGLTRAEAISALDAM